MKTYTIYHIPGKKVGCTSNFKRRRSQYSRYDVEILAELVACDATEAGEVENLFATVLGYKQDTVPYEHTITINSHLSPQRRSEISRKGGWGNKGVAKNRENFGRGRVIYNGVTYLSAHDMERQLGLTTGKSRKYLNNGTAVRIPKTQS